MHAPVQQCCTNVAKGVHQHATFCCEKNLTIFKLDPPCRKNGCSCSLWKSAITIKKYHRLSHDVVTFEVNHGVN